jgi:hypothetical protein
MLSLDASMRGLNVVSLQGNAVAILLMQRTKETLVAEI